MAYSVTNPYSSTPIKMASGNGSNPITFDRIAEPRRLPSPNQEVAEKTWRTRITSTAPGFNVTCYLGTHDNFTTWEFELPFVTPSQLEQLKEWKSARQSPILFSPDGGTNRYYAFFTDGTPQEEDYDLNQRKFFKVKVKLRILSSTTTTFAPEGS